MELIKLELQGFRGFKNKQQILFPKNLQPLVFVGVNGAGKTALLDAVRAGLKPFFYEKLLQSKIKTLAVELSDISVIRPKTELKLEWIYPIENLKETYSTEITAYSEVKFEYQAKSKKVNSDLIETILGNINLYPNQYSVAIVVYYPSERLVKSGDLDIEDVTDLPQNQLSAFNNALDSFIDFKTFFQWFRRTEDIENEMRLTEDETFTEPKLEAVRKAIMSMLDGFTSVRVQRSPFTDMVVKKYGQKLSVNQLSSGEKAVLTMAGDLAMRLAVANPGLKNPLEGRGMVLIDEVDLHLHPTWQTDIVARLQRTFPKIQFILTTHSPLIINKLALEQLYFLKDNECFPATQADMNTYGADILKVLAWQGVDAFLPDDIDTAFNEIDRLIKNQQFEQAKQKLKELKGQIDPFHKEILSLENELELKEMGI